MSTNQLLAVGLDEELIEITIGRDVVLQLLQDHPQWPTHQSGRPLRILDSEAFLNELCNYLMGEDENGSTPIHRAIEAAALEALEDGSENVESEFSLGADDFGYDDDVEVEDDDYMSGNLGFGSGRDEDEWN